MNIKKILSYKNSRKLHEQEQRLILIALIKTDFNIRKAHLLNSPELKCITYRTKVSRLFSIKALKKEAKELGYIN